MYSTSLPPSLKSVTLLNGQVRPATPLQNQRLSGYSANTVHIQQPLPHGDKLQFSGKRLEELKRKRELEAAAVQAKVKEREQAQFKAAMQQQILDEDINIKLNAYILGKLKVKFPEAYPGAVTPNLKKLEKAACDALRSNPDYPINKLIDDYISNNNDGNARPIKWTLLHKAIYHELPSLVNLILDERTPDVLIRDSEDISPLNTAEQMADNSDGRWSEAEMRVNQRIYERVKAKHDEQQAEIDKIDKAHKAELKIQADAAAEKAKSKPKKLGPAARREQQQEKKAREARLKAEQEKEQELTERFNKLDVPEPEPQEEDTEGTWETQKKAKSHTSSPTAERKSQASSPVSTRGNNQQRRSSTASSRKESQPRKTRQQEKSSATSVTSESPTMTHPSPASSGPAPMPENPWKKPWLESSSKTEPSIEAGEDAPKQSIDRTSTAPVASSSKLPSHPESLEEPPIRPLETMRDLSKTLPNLRTSGLASPSTFSFTTSSSASSLADRARIRQLKGQRDEQRLLLEQGSRNARDMQNALNWKDWHYNELLRNFHQMREQFLMLQQQMMAPPPMMPMIQSQPFVPLNEQQRTENLQDQEHVMQNMEHMQGLIRQLRDTTDPQALEKMKEDSEQPLAFVPDQSGTGYVIAEGPRAGEWFKEIPTELKPFKDQGKKFDTKDSE